jgi:hypothetical protein
MSSYFILDSRGGREHPRNFQFFMEQAMPARLVSLSPFFPSSEDRESFFLRNEFADNVSCDDSELKATGSKKRENAKGKSSLFSINGGGFFLINSSVLGHNERARVQFVSPVTTMD